MIIFPVHILASPLAILVAAIDTYLIVAAGYLLIRHFAPDCPGRDSIVRRWVEGPVRVADRQLATWRGRVVPRWASWATVVGVLLASRTIAVGLIVALV